MGILKWLKERRERYKSLIEYAPTKYEESLYISLYQDRLYVSIDETSIYYYGKHVLRTIICDLIYTLLKPHAVIAKDMGEEITPAGFGTMVERIKEGLFRDAYLYKDIHNYTYIYTNHLNKFEICQYVVCTDIMDIADGNRLYAVGYDVFERLKNGALAAEACIEKENYDFYIAPGGDRCGITVYRPSHEYGDIIEVIEAVMAPYGLAVKYGEENKEEEI